MKKYFVTGLVFLLPLALTIAIVSWIINIFTDPFVGFVSHFFNQFGLLQHGFLFLNAAHLQLYVSKILILASLFFFTVFLGWLTRCVAVHYFIRFGEYVFHRIPIVRTIYKTSQDMMKTIFGSTTKSFKQVVLAPFPNTTTLAVGLITREEIPVPTSDKKLTAVFIPTTPNPTSGFLMMYEDKDLIYLDIPVEDAFKYIISCGVLLPDSMHQSINKNIPSND